MSENMNQLKGKLGAEKRRYNKLQREHKEAKKNIKKMRFVLIQMVNELENYHNEVGASCMFRCGGSYSEHNPDCLITQAHKLYMDTA